MLEDKKEIVNGIGVVAEKAFDFIEKIIADPIIETTGIFADRIRYYRFKNQIDTVSKVRNLLKERGIKVPQKLPIKDITTFLEYVSFEENDMMQSKWANLLTNAIDPSIEFNACFLFSQILNQMSTNEVYVLNYIYTESCLKDNIYFTELELIEVSLVDTYNGVLLIDNLIRLRMLEEREEDYDLKNLPLVVGSHINVGKRYKFYKISNFGIELVRHVTN